MAMMMMTLKSFLQLFFLIRLDFTSSLSIPLGSTLYASALNNHSWYSPSSTFSVSFIPAAIPGTFLSAVTFSNTTPIWSPGTVDSGGSLRLLNSGSLRLLNSSGATVWDSDTENSGVSSASLDDSGNLLLLNHKNSTVWSSFAHPTNVIVPNQNFTVGKSLRSGSYSFQISKTGNLTLKWNNSIVYWNQGLLNSSIDSNLSSPSFVLQPNGVASIFDSSLPNGRSISIYSSDYGEGDNPFRFLKLDDDGNLRIYSSDSETETQRWVAIVDQCQVFGFCGEFGICRYDEDSSPICECPSENFTPVDVNDKRKGCRRKVELEDCPGNEAMLGLEHTRFLTYEPEVSSQRYTLGIEACRSNCLADDSGSCIASVSMADGSGVCFLKPPGFISGYNNPSFLSSSSLKVCKPVLPSPKAKTVKKNDKIHPWIIVVVIIATVFGLVIIELALWWFCCRNSLHQSHHTLLEYTSNAPMRFTYKELQVYTKGFKEKLGAGGFGAVYKGKLKNGTLIAVKRLEGIEQGEKQFRMEVATISNTHHLNLVRLIGFCSQGTNHRLLVYEFMKNGSLDKFVFETEKRLLLNWEYRFTIAVGTAKAILYLHEECSDCIVHCDIKPENILLDENFNAKVSDFGLAKLVPDDNRYQSCVRGTRGYLGPEWLGNLPITSKSDVYSYGMVLLEIVSGRRNFEVINKKKFSDLAYEEFEKDNVECILDECLEGDETVDMEQVKRMVQVCFWCIQKNPSQRPSMGKVVQMLEGVVEISKPMNPNDLADVSIM